MKTINTVLRFGSLAVAVGLLAVLVAFVKDILKHKTISISYLIISASLLALSIVPFFFNDRISEKVALVFSQSYILLLGIANALVIGHFLPWYDKQKFRWRLVFNICLVFFAMLLLTFGLEKLMGTAIFKPRLFASLIWFLFPLVIMEMVVAYYSIPSPVYIEWYYPIENPPGEPSDSELMDPIVISFVMKKKIDSKFEEVVFRSKAPVRMELGKLFYYFINDYNAKNPNSPIHYVDEQGKAYGWYLVKKKNNIFGVKRGLDPYISVQDNKLVENDIILCYRIQ